MNKNRRASTWKPATVTGVKGGQTDRWRGGGEDGSDGERVLYHCWYTVQHAGPAGWWHQPAAVRGPLLCLPPCCAERRTAGLKWSLAQRAGLCSLACAPKETSLWYKDSWNTFLKDTHINIYQGSSECSCQLDTFCGGEGGVTPGFSHGLFLLLTTVPGEISNVASSCSLPLSASSPPCLFSRVPLVFTQ